MKKIFTFFAAATIFAACNTNSDLDAKKDVVITDTSAMYNNNASTDIGTSIAQQAPAAVAPTRTIRETRIVYVDRAPKATRRIIREAAPAEPVITTVPQTQSNTGTAPQGSGTSGNSGTVGTNTGTETAPAEPVKKEREGWSNAAKDAVIGGVGGAIGGAILSRKKGKGAIIGGVIGAAGGYIFGRKKDKAEANEEAN